MAITVQPSSCEAEPRVFDGPRVSWVLRHDCLVITTEREETWIPMAQVGWFSVDRDPDTDPERPPRRARRRKVALGETRSY